MGVAIPPFRESRRIQRKKLSQVFAEPERVVTPPAHIEMPVVNGVLPVPPASIVVSQGGIELNAIRDQGLVGLFKFLDISTATPVSVNVVTKHQDEVESNSPVAIQNLFRNSILGLFARPAVADHRKAEYCRLVG